MSDIRNLDLEATVEALHVFASVKEWEIVTDSDYDVIINNGTAMAIYCEVEGIVLEIKNSKNTSSKVTPALQKGFNPWEVTSIVAAGTDISLGNCYLVSW